MGGEFPDNGVIVTSLIDNKKRVNLKLNCT